MTLLSFLKPKKSKKNLKSSSDPSLVSSASSMGAQSSGTSSPTVAPPPAYPQQQPPPLATRPSYTSATSAAAAVQLRKPDEEKPNLDGLAWGVQQERKMKAIRKKRRQEMEHQLGVFGGHDGSNGAGGGLASTFLSVGGGGDD